MTRDEKKRELTRMLKKAPEILSPRKAAQWSPLGRNAVYDLIRTGELRSFRYRDSYIIAKDDLIENLLDHADDADTRGFRRKEVRGNDGE